MTLVSECNLTMKEQVAKVHSIRKLLEILDIVVRYSSGFNMTH